MTPTAQIFRKHNFLILDKILNNGDYTIETNSFTDPNNEFFNQPLTCFENDRNNDERKTFAKRPKGFGQRSSLS